MNSRTEHSSAVIKFWEMVDYLQCFFKEGAPPQAIAQRPRKKAQAFLLKPSSLEFNY